MNKRLCASNANFFVHLTKLGLANQMYNFVVPVISSLSKQLRPLEFSDRQHGACRTGFLFCKKFLRLTLERSILRNCVRKLFYFFIQQSPCLRDTYKTPFCIRVLVSYLYYFSGKTLYNTNPLSYKVSTLIVLQRKSVFFVASS